MQICFPVARPRCCRRLPFGTAGSRTSSSSSSGNSSRDTPAENMSDGSRKYNYRRSSFGQEPLQGGGVGGGWAPLTGPGADTTPASRQLYTSAAAAPTGSSRFTSTRQQHTHGQQQPPHRPLPLADAGHMRRAARTTMSSSDFPSMASQHNAAQPQQHQSHVTRSSWPEAAGTSSREAHSTVRHAAGKERLFPIAVANGTTTAAATTAAAIAAAAASRSKPSHQLRSTSKERVGAIGGGGTGSRIPVATHGGDATAHKVRHKSSLKRHATGGGGGGGGVLRRPSERKANVRFSDSDVILSSATHIGVPVTVPSAAAMTSGLASEQPKRLPAGPLKPLHDVGYHVKPGVAVPAAIGSAHPTWEHRAPPARPPIPSPDRHPLVNGASAAAQPWDNFYNSSDGQAAAAVPERHRRASEPGRRSGSDAALAVLAESHSSVGGGGGAANRPVDDAGGHGGGDVRRPRAAAHAHRGNPTDPVDALTNGMNNQMSFAPKNGLPKKSNVSGLLSTAADAMQRTHGGRHCRIGLKNIANTCYMNSIIQCLSHARPLRQLVLSGALESSRSSASTGGGYVKEMCNLIRRLWNPVHGEQAIAPHELKSLIGRHNRRFIGASQHDANEVMTIIIDGLHNELNTGHKGPVKCDPNTMILPVQRQSDDRWAAMSARDNSVIRDIFTGQFRSTLTCNACGHKSYTFDEFGDVQLPIPKPGSAGANNIDTRYSNTFRSLGMNANDSVMRSLSGSKNDQDAVTLQACWNQFTREELLTGDERPFCEKCGKKQDSVKQILVQRLPKILILHLKRFEVVNRKQGEKISRSVIFGWDLDPTEFSPPQAANGSAYQLFAVANHSGSARGGHYRASCCNLDNLGEDLVWKDYDDAMVRGMAPVTSTKFPVCTDQAYVLFYERIDPA